jgi:hypothetical protein
MFVILILIFANLFSQADDPYRLNHKVEPVYQLIKLILDPDKDDYYGHTSIDIEIKENLTSFRLHGKQFQITEIELHQDVKSLPVKYKFQEHGLLTISSENELPTGDYTLNLRFKGQYDKRGQGIVKYTKDSLNYLYTHMEPIHARKFFPCFDEPNFKFTYQMEITSPKDYLVVSNTPEEKESVQDNSKTTLFKKTKPTPSYLLAFAVGPYETTPIPGLSIPGRIILSKGYLDKSHYIKENTAEILESLEDYFGSSYPYEKLDFIGPDYPGGAMENPGLVVYRQDYLIDDGQRTNYEKQNLIRVTAHELAHMWFGNLVSLKWWDDNWLKEGFAEWLAREILSQNYPDLVPLGQIAQSMNSPMRDDTKSTTEPIHRQLLGSDNPDEVFGSLTYSKSPAILRMVENWIGREAFRQAMKTYFGIYKWKNTSATDLFKILQNVSGKDVNQVMHDFIYQAGVPIITVNIKNNNTLVLSQKRYKSLENINTYSILWHIPVSLKFYDGNSVQERYLYMDQSRQEVSFPDLDTIEWVHLKSNLKGYYIQILPGDKFERALFSEELSLDEKNDLFTGLKYNYLAGNTNPTELLQLAYSLRKSSDIAIIESTVDRVTDVNNDFVDVVNKDNLHFYFDQTLTTMLESIGYEFNMDESNNKSNARMYLLGLLRHNDEVKDRGIELGKQYLLDDAPITFRNFMCLMLLFYYEGSVDIYEKAIKRLENPKSSSEQYVLSYIMGWFKNDSLIQNNLEYALSGDIGPFERMNIVNSIQQMYRNDKDTTKNILPWFHEHYAIFKEQISQDYLDQYFLTDFIVNYDDLNLFNQLFPEEERSKILNKRIAVKVEEFKRRKELQKLYADEVDKFLEDFKRKD